MLILTIIFVFPFLYTIFLFKTEYKKTNMAIKSVMQDEKIQGTESRDSKVE